MAAGMMARDRLAGLFSAELLELIEAVVDERVNERLTDLSLADDGPVWLSLEQAGERLGCSADAVRMRVKRGRLEARHEGRRVYVSRRSVDGLA